MAGATLMSWRMANPDPATSTTGIRHCQRVNRELLWPLGRRRKEPEPEPPAPPTKVTRLSVAEFWTAERRLSVGMDLSEGRPTDRINWDDSVRVVLLEVVPEDPSQQIDMRPGSAMDRPRHREEALLVFPPPQATDPLPASSPAEAAHRDPHRAFHDSRICPHPAGGAGRRLPLPTEHPVHADHAGIGAGHPAGRIRAARRGCAREPEASRRDP